MTVIILILFAVNILLVITQLINMRTIRRYREIVSGYEELVEFS